MARLSLTLPDELLAVVDRQQVNLSALLRRALAAMARCDHEELICARCAAPIDRMELECRRERALFAAWTALLEDATYRNLTLAGTARRARAAAMELGVRGADEWILPVRLAG